jgi:peptidyl-prolyl cis-trans isomerase SurA
MCPTTRQLLVLLRVAALLAFAAVFVGYPTAVGPSAAQTAKASQGKQKEAAPRGEQGIVVLVNDEPITAYQIDQRANFIGLNAGAGGPDIKAKAEARWQQIIKDPKTNERFQELLRQKQVQTREEAQALQKQYIMSLQQSMIEQIKREARAGAMPKLKSTARDELIDERIKLQEAKKAGVEVSDAEVKRFLTDLAGRNKLSYEQFVQHLKGAGVDIATVGERFRAQRAWRDVVMRKFGAQVTVTHRDVDRALTSTKADGGEDAVELQISKIALGLSSLDQVALTRRYAEATSLRRKFAGCRSMGELAKAVTGARFEDSKFVKPSAVPEPTRSMLLSAKDGEMLPPATTPDGVELYAVCGRRSVAVNDAQRSKAQEELQFQQLDLLAQRHMRNLKQDAIIEHR